MCEVCGMRHSCVCEERFSDRTCGYVCVEQHGMMEACGV